METVVGFCRDTKGSVVVSILDELDVRTHQAFEWIQDLRRGGSFEEDGIAIDEV
jgi:hypothetical protein